MNKTPTGKGILSLLIIAFFVCGCSPRPRMEKIMGFAQGSYYALSYYTDRPELYADKLQVRIDSLLAAFDLCASLWNDSSEICRVNRNEDFEPSRMFCDMLHKSQSISELTDGAFDITVGPLVKTYGFGAGNQPGRTLGDEELIEILQYVGWEKIRIENGKVVKDHPELKIDFNAIAQGYCADITAEFLRRQGIERYLVDIGGEICSQGRKENGEPWVVGIEKPAPDAMSGRSVLSKMALENQSLVTSGNYRKYFEEDGHRYSHTIDPRTGKSVQHSLLSATVLCKECWEADAIATACMVFGKEKSVDFYQTHSGRYELFLIYAEPVAGQDSVILKTWHSPNFPLL